MFENATSFGLSLGITTICISILLIITSIVLRIYKPNNIVVKIITKLIAFIALVYFIIFRYTQDVINLINKTTDYSIRYSKVLLLDLCPFAYVALCIATIIDWKGNSLKVFSLWSMIGSLITILGSVWTADTNDPLKYIFIGSDEGALYFFLHAFMLFLGVFQYIYYSRFTFREIYWAHLYISLYLIYVFIIMKTMDITRNVTGLAPFDWVNPWGEYNVVYIIFNYLKFPDIMFLSYFLVWLLMLLLIGLRNFFGKYRYQWFFPKWMYKKIWFINYLSVKNAMYRLKKKRY